MKISKTSFKYFLIASLITIGLSSCSKDNDNNSNGGTANLTVRMTDAPGDYDAVNIDVEDVEIHVESDGTVEGDEDGDGWVSIGNVHAGVYDLLELTGGISQLLADTEVPAGYVSQIRLVLGSNNTVVVDGQSKPLNTPSAQQSGLKLQLNQQFEAGESYSFLLDFDVDESITTTGNGAYILKPVIRVSAEAGASSIVGTVLPPEDFTGDHLQSLVKITSSDGNNITISAYTDADGNFSLNGVPAGTYKLEVINDADLNINIFTIDGVVVEADSTKDLGEIQLL